MDSSDLNVDFKLYLVSKILGGGKSCGYSLPIKVRIAFDYAIDLFQDCVILLNKIKIELMSTFKEVNKS